MRWNIETLFEDYKDLLGSDHYQVMSDTAIVRFWTLVSCLAYLLDKQRAILQAERPGVHITWGMSVARFRPNINAISWSGSKTSSGRV